MTYMPLQLLSIGMITDQEALNMVKSATPPASVQAYLDALPSESDRIRAEIDFAADNYYRNNPLLTYLMSQTGATEADMDNFFIAASAL